MMPKTKTELERLNNKIEELQRQRDKLLARQQLFEAHPLWQLAEEHHAATCHHNHADACDWYYHEWGDGNLGYAKGVSLRVAATVQRLIDEALVVFTGDPQQRHDLVHETIADIFKALKER